MEEVKFYVRCYDKIELARMYFPNLSNPVSVAKLRRWMRNCMPLMEELMAGDFHPKMKCSVRGKSGLSYVIWGNRTDTFSCMNMRM